MVEAETGILWLRVLLTGLAIGLGVGSLFVPVFLADLPSRWSFDSSRSLLFSGSGEAEGIANPFGLRVAEFGGKYAIMWNTTGDSDLLSFAGDPTFIWAVQSEKRLVMYASGGRSVLLVGNATLKEALTLSREKAVANQLSQQVPHGAYVLSEEAILGKSWLALASEYWLLAILLAALLYALYVVAYTLLVRKGEEE